jgi:solute:Na+ symporter, SSS family
VRWVDVLIIGAYLCCLVGISLYFARRQKSTETYFVAERSIPGWAMGLSLTATIITSVSFIAYPGAAYGGNWSLIVPGFMFVIVLVLAGKVFVPFFRHSVRMSAYEYFGRRFGQGIRLYSSFAFAIGHFAKMGFVFYLFSLTLASITSWNFDRILFVTGIVTIFYTLVGGMETVIWTDVLQGFVLILGICICIGFLLWAPPGGPHTVLADAWQHHKFSLGSTQMRFDKPTILVLSIYGLFFYIQKYTADQTVVQRYLVARSDESAFRGIALGAGLCIPVWAAFMLIGSLLWAFYRAVGEKLPANIAKAEQVFPHFIVTHIPVGFAGLFIASLFGSAMSMLGSDMNCLAVIGVEDYYRLLRPRSTDKSRLRAGRWIVVASGMGAAATGWLLDHSHGSALSLYYTVSAIVAGGLAGLFLLAFLWARAGRVAAQVAVVASLAATAWATLTADGGKMVDLGNWNFPWHTYMIGAVSNIVLLAVGFLCSLIFPGPMLSDQNLTLWGWLRKKSVERISVTTK